MVRRSRAPALQTQIISTLDHPIPTKELLTRLQKLADALSTVDQDNVVQAEYSTIAQDLANKKLLKHQNQGVRALACCALADVLRIFAPDAPFDAPDLSHIFRCFFAQFALLWNEEDAYFLQRCYLLKRIVEVRSVVLVADLPDAAQLVSTMFETMYALATKGFPLKLEHLACEMLAETVAEADAVPQKVVSLILKRLTTSDSTLLGLGSNISNPAFAFSLAVCESNVDKMSRQVAQLFSEMLDESAKARDDDVDYSASFQTLEKIHSWSVHIWKHVPELLGSVMGLIADELNSDTQNVRVLATATIGGMIASSSQGTDSSVMHFATAHKTAWNNWVKKYSDVSPAVRCKWVEQIPPILASQGATSDMTNELRAGLSKCLMDSSDKVRLACCEALELLSFPVFTNKMCNENTLSIFFQLIREKNADIRNKAINFLADTYNHYMALSIKQEIIDFGTLSEKEIKRVEEVLQTDIPNKLIQLNYINDRLTTTTVDVALFERILPFENDANSRVARLCSFYNVLDEKSKQAFIAITKRQKKNGEVLAKFIELAELYTKAYSLDGENKENATENAKEQGELLQEVDKIIQWLTVSFPDGLNSYDCLDRFFKLKNARLINLVKNCINFELDYKTVKNSIKELLVTMSDSKNIKLDGVSSQVSTSDMVSNFKVLLYRSSTIFYNKSNVPALLKYSLISDDKFRNVANEIINNISSLFPDVFVNHINTLSDFLTSQQPGDVDCSLLKSYYYFVRKFPDSFPEDASFLDALVNLATTGTPQQAKYAVKILGCSDRIELLASRIVESALPLSVEDKHFATHLSSVAELYLVAHLALSSHFDHINSVIVDHVLRTNRIDYGTLESIKGLDWIDDVKVETQPVIVEKVLALRLIMNRLRSAAKEGEETALRVAEKPLRLLLTIIANSGEIVKPRRDVQATPPAFQLRLRLAAGLCVLKLAKYPCFSTVIDDATISKLKRLLHDEVKMVRQAFLKSVERYLSRAVISERFLHLPFFLGHEPNTELKNNAKTWIMSQHKRYEAKSDIVLERILARLIHAIAHDQRFTNFISEDTSDEHSKEVKAFIYALGYLTMYLETVAKQENISLLYYFASRVKQYRDAQVDAALYLDSEPSAEVLNLYRVAELLQLMLKELADNKGWTLQTWPGKIKLPSVLFAPMQDYQEAQETVSRVYIGDKVQIELRQLLKKPGSSAAKRRAPVQSKATPKKQRVARAKKPKAKKAVSPPATPIRRSARATRKKVSYEEVGNDEESEEEESSEAELSDESEYE